MDSEVVIESSDELQAWISDNEHSFDDGEILGLELQPSPGPGLPVSATLELGARLTRGWKAGEPRALAVFRFQALDIRTWELRGEAIPGHCTEGFDVMKDRSLVAFSIDLPAVLEVRCERLRVIRLPDWSGFVRPHPSDSEVVASVPGRQVPSPGEWIELYKEQGLDVGWRTIGGGITPTEEVPPVRYEGWAVDLLTGDHRSYEGVYVMHCRPTPNGFDVALRRQGSTEEPWKTSLKLLSTFEGAEIRSGNCVFSQAEWTRYVSAGELPDRMRR